MADLKEKYPRNPTPDQIAEWKIKYGAVHKLTFAPEIEIQIQQIPEEEGSEKMVDTEVEVETYPEAVCYLRAPNRKDLAYAQRANETGGQLAFNSALLNNCFVGGDPIVKTKDSYFLGAGPHLAEIIEVKEAKLEKL